MQDRQKSLLHTHAEKTKDRRFRHEAQTGLFGFCLPLPTRGVIWFASHRNKTSGILSVRHVENDVAAAFPCADLHRDCGYTGRRSDKLENNREARSYFQVAQSTPSAPFRRR
jgi:hypothetical protein